MQGQMTGLAEWFQQPEFQPILEICGLLLLEALRNVDALAAEYVSLLLYIGVKGYYLNTAHAIGKLSRILSIVWAEKRFIFLLVNIFHFPHDFSIIIFFLAIFSHSFADVAVALLACLALSCSCRVVVSERGKSNCTS